MSEAQRGNKNPKYGKIHTKEHREKIGRSLTGRTLSTKTRMKMSESKKGRIVSEDTRKKLSEINQGKKHSKETRRKMSNVHKGHPVSEETRQKIGDALRGEKSPNWCGGASFEPYPPEFNEHLKRKIRERDNYTCQISGEWGNVVHHIDYNK